MGAKVYKIILVGCMVGHLALVTISASHIKIADGMPGKAIIDFYNKASGAGSSYSFFAPSMGVKTRALFDLVGEDGSKVTDIPLSTQPGREVELRLYGISDEFICKNAEDPSFRQPLAASLAASIFARDATVAEAILRVQEFRPITMEEYRRGERAHWSEYYVARFARIPEEGNEQ